MGWNEKGKGGGWDGGNWDSGKGKGGEWDNGNWDESKGGGSWDNGSWDDGKGESCVAQPRDGAETSCRAKRSTQICACRRACADEGPWQCHEEGCPARTVPCEMLSVACRARFSDIWRKPPPGMAGRTVRQSCPLSCGACVSSRDDFEEADAVAAGRALLGAKPARVMSEILR